jgi:quinol monooxygenase YgiN
MLRLAGILKSKQMNKKVALLVRLEAKPGKEKEVADFLRSGLPLVQEEHDTVTWYGVQFGPSSFGIFDTFPHEEGRKAHLSGKVAKALMENAPKLLAKDPEIIYTDILAVKREKVLAD